MSQPEYLSPDSIGLAAASAPRSMWIVRQDIRGSQFYEMLNAAEKVRFRFNTIGQFAAKDEAEAFLAENAKSRHLDNKRCPLSIACVEAGEEVAELRAYQ